MRKLLLAFAICTTANMGYCENHDPDTEIVCRIPAEQRKEMFQKAHNLKLEGMRNMEQAERYMKQLTHWQIDWDVKTIVTALITDCITEIKTSGKPSALVAVCATEIFSQKIHNSDVLWHLGEHLHDAEMAYYRAEKIEYELWTDEEAEDWL